ncbi:hypothetical protein LIER_42545 [Lithospermum erythrorhizon]|uniref:Uncharacterized protein n=1 Tax=Lithospermum erythrorhizon TaxID=34254 RepID=A0AAV3NJH0_LITER
MPPKPHDNSLPQTVALAHNAATLAPAQATAYSTPTVQLPAQAPANAIPVAQLPAQVPAISQTLPPATFEEAPAHMPAYAHLAPAAINLALAPSPAHGLGLDPSGPCASSTSSHLPDHGPAAHIHAAQPPSTST